MKRLFSRQCGMLGRMVCGAGVATVLAIAGAVGAPAAQAAACDAGDGSVGITATDGSCCNAGHYQISNGTITCSGSACATSNGTPAESCFITTYVNPAIVLLSSLVGVTVIASIVWGAIQYITSGGDPGKAAAGKKKITNALIGLVAFIVLFAFLQFILPGGVLNGK